MISLAEARHLIFHGVRVRPGVAVDLAAASGRVLTEAVRADSHYPDGDRAQMDGYAVRADAVPGVFRLTGEVPAGAVPHRTLEAGECVRIFTGALLPPGAGRVVMQEDAVREGNAVTLAEFGSRIFVRKKGSEAVPGQTVVPAGTLLGPPELAALAQAGAVRPRVVPAPSVRHLATGGELVDPAEKPGPGLIRDTNSTLLRALFAGAGVTEFTSSRVPDDPEALAAAAETSADLLILSGGASVGDYDYGAAVLRRLGYTIHFDRVNLRPGKPLTFATRGGQAAFLLPGNPVSHFVCFHTAVRLAVERASGRPASWPAVWLELDPEAGEPLTGDPRETWWPARAVVRPDGQAVVRPKRWSTSGDTFSLAGTNALVLVNPESPRGGKGLTLLLEPPALS